MASVEKTVVQKQVVVDEDAYVLTLSKEEALVLVGLLGMVGGDQQITYRKYCTPIWQCLDRAFPDRELMKMAPEKAIILPIIRN